MEPIILFYPNSFFTPPALKNAAYRFLSDWQFEFETIDDKFKVSITSLHKNQNNAEMKELFQQAVLDHQIRVDTANDYKLVREMIIAQAFEPCENVGEVADSIIK